MNHVTKLYSLMQEDRKEKEPFNERLLNLKENDDFLKYVDVAAKTLDVVEGIEYLGSRIGGEKDVIESRKHKRINESRLIMIHMKFRVTGYDDTNKMDKSEEVDVPILFFKLMNGSYFIYNGIRYIPIFQLTDKIYVLKDKVVLKTLIMGIFLGSKVEVRFKESGEFTSENTNLTISGHLFSGHLFKKRINIMHYYLAKFGLKGTLEYFDMKDDDIIILNKKHSEDYKNEYESRDVFSIKKGNTLAIRKNALDNQFKIDVAIALINMFKLMPFRYSVFNAEYFTKKLGGYFGNISNGATKGAGVLVSFERLLDDHTKSVLGLPEDTIKDTYSIVKWMMGNYRKLRQHSNMDISKKRIRFYEYMIVPLVISFNTSSHRISNARGKVTFSILSSVFNKLKKHNGSLLKSSMKNELIRYDNMSFNFFDMFHGSLRVSQKGPQSIASRGIGRNDVPSSYRALDPSFVGRVSLISASAGDPGMNLVICPTTKLDDKLYFSHLDEDLEEEVSKLYFTKTEDSFDDEDDLFIRNEEGLVLED